MGVEVNLIQDVCDVEQAGVVLDESQRNNQRGQFFVIVINGVAQFRPFPGAHWANLS